VDPVPDPLLLRKSGSAGDRTRDLYNYQPLSIFFYNTKKLHLFDENYRLDLKYITQHSVMCKTIKDVHREECWVLLYLQQGVAAIKVPVNCNETQTL